MNGGTYTVDRHLASEPAAKVAVAAWLAEHDVDVNETTRLDFEWVGTQEFCTAGQDRRVAMRFAVKRPFPGTMS